MANRDIGARLLARRNELGMTGDQLSARVGISQAQICRLENGLQGFRSDTLFKMAKGLGRPPFYFYMNDKQWEAYERGSR